jgi:siderophore synthetase component
MITRPHDEDPASVADTRCAENLLACYCREIAFPAGEATRTGPLEVRLPASGRVIRAPTTWRTLVGGFEIECPVTIDGDPIDALSLCAVLTAEIAARFQRAPHPELAALVRDSRGVTEALLRVRPPRADGYLASEQALTFGHPYHPSPKARAGFDADDLARYSPEAGAAFRLHVLAVSSDLIEEESIERVSCSALVDEALGGAVACPDGFALIPAHPWQVKNVLESGMLDGFLATGELLDLGPVGPTYFATSSVRTLYRPGAPYFLKASLGVRITNCIRRNAAHELRCAVQVSRWMRAERPRLAALFPTFGALDEIAWRTLYPHEGDLGVRGYLGELFGFLLRDARPVAALEPRVAAALFGNRDEGRARMAALLPPARRQRWFEGYLDALVAPMLHLFFEAGLMFEPHLQNVLVAGFGEGEAARVLLRDYDNAKIVEGIFDPVKLVGLLPEVVAELRYPEEVAWKRFVYCLFVNNLAEVIAALANGDAAGERRLWGALREHLRGIAARSGRGREAIERLTAGEELPAKANLLTRVFKQKDRDAPFVGVPNPMAGAGAW